MNKKIITALKSKATVLIIHLNFSFQIYSMHLKKLPAQVRKQNYIYIQLSKQTRETTIHVWRFVCTVGQSLIPTYPWAEGWARDAVKGTIMCWFNISSLESEQHVILDNWSGSYEIGVSSLQKYCPQVFHKLSFHWQFSKTPSPKKNLIVRISSGCTKNCKTKINQNEVRWQQIMSTLRH